MSWLPIILILIINQTTSVISEIQSDKFTNFSPSARKSTTTLNQLKELLKILEITTYLEGDIDPDDNIKLTTRIVDHQNGETTYLSPSFENIDGKFKYSQSLLQEDNAGKYSISGSSNSEVQGTGNIGLHVQQFDYANESQNKKLFKKYSRYLKLYIDYLYKYNLDIDSTYLKDLQRNFVYYGSLANGENPALQSNFQMTNLKRLGARSKKYETIGGSQGSQDSSISYGISNIKGNEDAHSFQNMISTAAGAKPLSGVQVKTHSNDKYIRGSIVGQAVSKPSEGVSMTTIDTVGENEGYGFSDHNSHSEQNATTLATISQVNNLSVASSQVDKGFRNVHDQYFAGKDDKQDDKQEINTELLSEKMKQIGTHAENKINGDIFVIKQKKSDFVDSDPFYPQAEIEKQSLMVEGSKSLKRLKDFIEVQAKSPIVPQRKINVVNLENKIEELFEQKNEREKNGGIKKTNLDGAVVFNRTSTISSLKNINDKSHIQFKFMKPIEIEQIIMPTQMDQIEITKEDSLIIKEKSSEFIESERKTNKEGILEENKPIREIQMKDILLEMEDITMDEILKHITDIANENCQGESNFKKCVKQEIKTLNTFLE